MDESKKPLTIKDLKELPESIVDAQWNAYVRARDNGHTKYVADAKMFDDYYFGEQWTDVDREILSNQRRPAQTVNLVLSTVNAVVGQYLDMRQDIEVKPVNQDANEDVARAITKIMRHISYDSQSRTVEKQVFTDGVIQDRGFFDIRLDFSENVFGEIRETALDPRDVLLDPGARDYDPRTWSEVFYTRWLTPDQIAELYGQEAGDKLMYCDSAGTYGLDSVELDPETFSQKKSFYTSGPDGYTYQDDWKSVRRVRVIERQRFKLAEQRFFVDLATGDTSPVPDGWDDAKIQQVMQVLAQARTPVQVIKRLKRRVRWTVTCDKNLIHDGWSPYDWFTIVPFFPYFRRGRGFGVVRNLVSNQDILNKVTSQELHVINTTANSGWVIEEGSLANMSVEQLEQIGAKTGLVLSYNRGSQAPTKILPNQIPTGLDRVSQKTVSYFREISGVSEAMLGQIGREISGAALESKQNRGLVQLNVVFDNLAVTRQIRGEIMLGMIQKFYTDTRVMRILGVGEEGEATTEAVALNQPLPTGEILNDVTLGEYKCVVTSSPAKDTEADTDIDQLIRMREIGVVVPDWALIEASRLSNRKEIADWNRKLTGAAEPTEEEIALAQMQQELELQQQSAVVSELQAKAQERLANAAKLMAEAQMLPEELRAKQEQFGAQLRKDLEQQIIELQKNREDLMARIVIAREKNKTQQYTANLQTLAKRLDTEAKERIGAARATARVTSSRKK